MIARFYRGLSLTLVLASCGAPPAPPTVIPWAWQRAEDLTFLSADVPVAAWFATITVVDGELDVTRRTQPLRYHASAPLIAVIRIESTESFANPTRQRIVKTIVEVVDAVGANEVQLDFDARRSQRSDYRRLIEALNDKTALAISITALASWCFDDDWLGDASVDEVVPMLYRMGASAESIRARLTASSRPSLRPPCHGSVGYITDEPVVAITGARRVFLFSDTPWTARSFYDFRDYVIDRLERWD